MTSEHWLRSGRMRPNFNRQHSNTPRAGTLGREDAYIWDNFHQYPMYPERQNSTFGTFNGYEATPMRDPRGLGARPKERQTPGRAHGRQTPGSNRAQMRQTPGLNNTHRRSAPGSDRTYPAEAFQVPDPIFGYNGGRGEEEPEGVAMEEEGVPEPAPTRNQEPEQAAPGVPASPMEEADEGAEPGVADGNGVGAEATEEHHRNTPGGQSEDQQAGNPLDSSGGGHNRRHNRTTPGEQPGDRQDRDPPGNFGRDRDPPGNFGREPGRGQRQRGTGGRDDPADEGDFLLIFVGILGLIFSCLFNINLILGVSAVGLTLYLTGLQVWQDIGNKYWSSPWMIQYTCVSGLVLIVGFYINKFCRYRYNRSIVGLLKVAGRHFVRRFRSPVVNANRAVDSRSEYNDGTYVINGGNTLEPVFPQNNLEYHHFENLQNQTSSQSARGNSQMDIGSRPSGGWNGDYHSTSTPAPPSRVSRGHNTRPTQPARNFRPDAGYNNLGTESPHINFREDLNTSHSDSSQGNEPSYYYSLSHEDRTIIDQLSPLASTHNLTLPKWDGVRETYEDFRLSFMSFVPTIPVLLRLESLKRALERCPDALRVIAEFTDTSTEAFSGAIIALDGEYDNEVEVIERLTDGIQALTTVRASSPDEFVNNINKMTVLITKLSRRVPNTRLTLAPLVKEWLKYIPDNINKQVIRNVEQYGRSWISFVNVYSLCTKFVKGWKNTKDLVKRREEAQKSVFKKSQVFTSETSPVSSPVQSLDWNPPADSSYEEKEVLYARTFGKPKCCFCTEEAHPSVGCPKLPQLATLQKAERFVNRNCMLDNLAKVRCYLCMEQGHTVDQCLLTQHRIVPIYQCNCNVRPVHNKHMCDVLAHKSQVQPPRK